MGIIGASSIRSAENKELPVLIGEVECTCPFPLNLTESVEKVLNDIGVNLQDHHSGRAAGLHCTLAARVLGHKAAELRCVTREAFNPSLPGDVPGLGKHRRPTPRPMCGMPISANSSTHSGPVFEGVAIGRVEFSEFK